MELKLISENKTFNGSQKVYSHYSEVCKCDMTFGLFLPEASENYKVPILWFLSGLTCTHENAMTKSGAQQWASEMNIALVFPDTSPRGKSVPNHVDFDLGQGAGFYLDATEDPWNKNFNMETYIIGELNDLLFKKFNLNKLKQGITGHSMGGLGALNLALKNPQIFKSASAFSPITNPTQSEWGQKQFSSYLGTNQKIWTDYDPSLLLKKLGFNTQILVDQGKADNFIELLMPKSLSDQMEGNINLGKFRYHDGYDHSYFFVSTFIKEHIIHHTNILSA
ncbi:MAG: S-formylglutathione hydrolase [Paracoccaceae bacterium]|nr:S-formylglutathione hydrolase [Paracoccaceae bacterium]